MTDTNNTQGWSEFIEAGADIEHTRWAKWQSYLHSQCIKNPDGSLTIPAERVTHWQRQIDTPYAELSEKEKESDRNEVRTYLPLLASAVEKARESKCPDCNPKDEHIIETDRSTTRVSRPCGGCGKHQTIAGALLKSPQWKEWYEHASKNRLYDVDETLTIDAMSDGHFKDFMEFSARHPQKISNNK